LLHVTSRTLVSFSRSSARRAPVSSSAISRGDARRGRPFADSRTLKVEFETFRLRRANRHTSSRTVRAHISTKQGAEFGSVGSYKRTRERRHARFHASQPSKPSRSTWPWFVHRRCQAFRNPRIDTSVCCCAVKAGVGAFGGRAACNAKQEHQERQGQHGRLHDRPPTASLTTLVWTDRASRRAQSSFVGA
jgi:hypothetical protein